MQQCAAVLVNTIGKAEHSQLSAAFYGYYNDSGASAAIRMALIPHSQRWEFNQE